MTPEQVAQTCLLIIQSQGLSKEGAYEVLGRLATGLVNPSAEAVAAQTPMQAAAVPTQPSKGPIMVEKGFEAFCTGCDQVIYNVASNVYENMSKKEFKAAYQPAFEGVPEFPMPIDAWPDPYGNYAIDCPVCKGRKTLWIKGRGPQAYSEYPEGTTS